MGRRLVFYQSNQYKSLEMSFLHAYVNFRTWILKEYKNLPSNSYELEFSDEMLQFLIQNQSILDFCDVPQQILDKMLSEYFLCYCEHDKETCHYRMVGSMMNFKSYRKTIDFFERQHEKDLDACWRFIIKGRSIANNQPFTPDIDGVIGFWTVIEQRILLGQLKKLKKENK